ncbi:MAG: RelA/SpoT domain-containing protein [Bacteroidetes bacterium]|nr:RelA/SpoT domain-containing protein [Bacteroidota bacterium]
MPKYYPKPEFAKNQVNKAGDILISTSTTDTEKDYALLVINNWRASHNFPLNTFQMRLRKLAKKINPESLVAQRIKRLASIKFKLERFPSMNMAQIQDIGGCRAIMKDIVEVDALVNKYKHESRGMKHKLHVEDDYILRPKITGYRGVHLVYKYKSDKSTIYDNLKIEIQIRTLMQHAWATAVETVGTFIRQSLKSSQGEEDWLRFFALMSSAMAITEGKPTVPNTPLDIDALRSEITLLSKKLDVEGHLTTFRNSIEVLGGGDRRASRSHYYLLELDASAGRVYIKAYSQTQLATASADYIAIEKRIANDNRDAVLVSADSIDALKLAYPNYYLDTDLFLQHLKRFTRTGQLSLF